MVAEGKGLHVLPARVIVIPGVVLALLVLGINCRRTVCGDVNRAGWAD